MSCAKVHHGISFFTLELLKHCGNDVGIDVGNIDVETRRLEGLDTQSRLPASQLDLYHE